MNDMFKFYDHNPHYHHGLSKKEHVEQETDDWFLAYYGPHYSRYNRMRCYGRPIGWEWSIKDRVDGPRTRNSRRFVRRWMRKRARRQGKRDVLELEREYR